MSYTPTNWQTGDVVTSAKLNKLEQAVSDTLNSSAIFLVTRGVTSGSEIEQALSDGKMPVVQWQQVPSNSTKHDYIPLTNVTYTDAGSENQYNHYHFNYIYREASNGPIYNTSIGLLYYPQDNTNQWGNFITNKIVDSTRTINGKSLTQDVVLGANDITYDYYATYNNGSVGQAIKNASNQIGECISAINNIFIFSATPVYNELDELVSYTINSHESIIYDAMINHQIIICYIEFHDRIFNTMVNYSGSEQTGYSLDVHPIIRWHNNIFGDVLPFSLEWDYNGYYNGVDIREYEARYILPMISIDDPAMPYGVPMMDYTNTNLAMNTINEYVDFGTTIDQLIIGALDMAASNGQASLATYIDDSSTVQIASEVISMCRQDVHNARGVIARFQYGLNEIYANMSSFEDQGTYRSVTFLFERIGNNYVGNTFTGSEVYTGKIIMNVHYYTDQNDIEVPDYTIGIVHINKYDAQAV